ncbi:hypothetical protein Q5Y75_24460 [Ruegeria sp. 2205SS24-7]|uniref:hypothetical protein n=1 Tax=Ruegeria discodermiae TaxID=3064389 RepID=UPI0027427522|nr:hypothetical protein [Ruegeria sp. 2205SS24-7]MDP5220348.1 hypothetical protein [Ruegeria sp. 2205SS24-7]
MKFVVFASLVVCLFQLPAFAQSSGIFGLGNSELACRFVEEAEIIANVADYERYSYACGTRSVRKFDEMQLLQDAYRADPEATLDLIERILKAGKSN